DIFIKSLSIFEPCVILELKVCDKPKDIFKKCDEALAQIEAKNYEEELKEEGYENIIKYGISFYRKDCVIKVKE
ncbi:MULTISPECIES: PD-(D/E)XK nuclease domain-containing protein, partial [unclassified Clostridium]